MENNQPANTSKCVAWPIKTLYHQKNLHGRGACGSTG